MTEQVLRQKQATVRVYLSTPSKPNTLLLELEAPNRGQAVALVNAIYTVLREVSSPTGIFTSPLYKYTSSDGSLNYYFRIYEMGRFRGQVSAQIL